MQNFRDKDGELFFQFKGNRNYVQGPDIFDAMSDYLSKEFSLQRITNITFSAHKLISTSIHVELYDQFPTFQVNIPCATLMFTFNGNRKFLYGYASTNEITSKIEFDENKLLDSVNFDINEKSCIAYNALLGSTVELLVALNKALLQKIFPELQGKWLFVKLELIKHLQPNQGEKIQLRLIHNLGFRLMKSSILISGLPVGFIFFSLQKT